MGISVIVHFRAIDDKRTEFLAILDNVKSELPKTQGCIGVVIYQNAEDASRFTLVEMWESKELHKKHLDKLVDSGAWENIAAYLSEDVISGYYNVI